MCFKCVNEWVMEFNIRIKKFLEDFNKCFFGVKFVFVDIYLVVFDFIDNFMCYGKKILFIVLKLIFSVCFFYFMFDEVVVCVLFFFLIFVKF